MFTCIYFTRGMPSKKQDFIKQYYNANKYQDSGMHWDIFLLTNLL